VLATRWLSARRSRLEANYRHVAAEDLGDVRTSAELVKISFAQRPQRGIADPARNQVARPRR
jgi:hypothetical protein